VILFDGHCLLCSRSVRRIHKRDRANVFKFAAQQSPESAAVLAGRQIPPDLDSLIVVDGDLILTHSDAVLRIGREMGFPYSWAAVFRVLPRGFRDVIYRFVARHRYRIWGRSEACFMPEEGLRERFVI